jgi:hypothetical protein
MIKTAINYNPESSNAPIEKKVIPMHESVYDGKCSHAMPTISSAYSPRKNLSISNTITTYHAS